MSDKIAETRRNECLIESNVTLRVPTMSDDDNSDDFPLARSKFIEKDQSIKRSPIPLSRERVSIMSHLKRKLSSSCLIHKYLYLYSSEQITSRRI